MKKTFLAKRNALFSSTDISWGAYALVFAVLMLLVRLLAPNFFWHAFAPVFWSADALTAQSHTFLQSFSDTAALAAQNEQLSAENAALVSENQTLLKRTADLKALFGSPERAETGAPEILAGVVARPPASSYDTLVLAAGEDDGVALGMGAFGAGGVPIGVVSSVVADFSRVTLFSSPGIRTNGWVGQAGLPLTLIGEGAGAISATLARRESIAVGDKVFSSGPGRLLVGEIVRIDSDPSTPSMTLRIMPVQNPFSIAWVTLRDIGATLLP